MKGMENIVVMESKKLWKILFLFVAGALLYGGVYLYRQRQTAEAEIVLRKLYSKADSEPVTGSLAEDTGKTFESLRLDESEVTWNGKKYRRNTYMKAILCIGVDRKNKMTEIKELGEAGQADGIFLIAQDTARNKLKILMIPRDTLTEITVLNPDGTIKGKEIDHLLMAYAYGDGREGSCQNIAESVSELFHGLSIDSYLAMETTMIGALNDAVGGVTVTVPTPGMEKADPAFVFGEAVTLKGDQAEAFVRYRDIETDHSAIFRMNQQKEYIVQYFEALQKKNVEDSQIVTRLFSMIEDYMVTDMEKEQYLKIALDAVEGDGISGEDFYMVPGTDVTTDAFDEFHVDEEKMISVILELFYREL